MWIRTPWSTKSNALEKTVKIVSTWVLFLKASQINYEKPKKLIIVKRLEKKPCWLIYNIGKGTLSVILRTNYSKSFPIKRRLDTDQKLVTNIRSPAFKIFITLIDFHTNRNLHSLKDLLKMMQWKRIENFYICRERMWIYQQDLNLKR